MADKVTYYAMLLEGDTPDAPSGVARRSLLEDGGIRDEAFRRDCSWGRTPLIAGSDRGDMTFTLVEISAVEADRVLERLRTKWGAPD